MKKVIEIIKKKWLMQTTLTIVLIFIIIAVYLLINIGFQKLNLNPLDFTKEKLYTLSDESKQIVKDIDKQVNIYFFGFDTSSTAYSLAKQYENVNEKIVAEIIDIDERPDLALKYGVESNTDVGIVIQSEERYKILSTSDLYTYDTSTYETIDITEQKLTNSIVDMTIASKPKIYFLTGHDEYNLSSEMAYLKVYLQNDVNDVDTLNLLTTELPDDCDTLVIASPLKDFTELESNKIIEYIKNGGNILWFNDATIEDVNLPNVQKVLDEYGVAISKGTIVETNSNNMLISNPYLVIPKVNYHEITKDIYNGTGVVLPSTGKLNIQNEEKLEELNVEIMPIIESTDTSFYRENFAVSTASKTSSDEEGTFTIAAEAIKTINDETKSKLIIFANNVFVSDTAIQIQNQHIYAIALYNNKDIALNSIAYLTDRGDTIRIRKDTGYVTYTATQTEDNIIRAIIFIVPILIIILGIVIWQVRRRKK